MTWNSTGISNPCRWWDSSSSKSWLLDAHDVSTSVRLILDHHAENPFVNVLYLQGTESGPVLRVARWQSIVQALRISGSLCRISHNLKPEDVNATARSRTRFAAGVRWNQVFATPSRYSKHPGAILSIHPRRTRLIAVSVSLEFFYLCQAHERLLLLPVNHWPKICRKTLEGTKLCGALWILLFASDHFDIKTWHAYSIYTIFVCTRTLSCLVMPGRGSWCQSHFWE